MRYVVIVAGWLWGLTALPQVTDAALSLGGVLLLVPSGLLIGLVWWIYSTWLIYSGAVRELFRTRRVPWLWLSVPVIGLGALFLNVTLYGLTIRVWLCDSELREYAESVRQNPDGPHESRCVGLFELKYRDGDKERVDFYTTRAGFMDSAGIVYQPDGAPPNSDRYEHLYGPWWRFREKF